MKIYLYEQNVWRNIRIMYNGKYYLIDDGSDYFLRHIHQIFREKIKCR